MGLNILFTVLLVLVNGFFVAAEFALVKVRMSQIELKAKEGNRLAKLTLTMLQDLEAYLSASQLGITLASLGLGWIGESVVAGKKPCPSCLKRWSRWAGRSSSTLPASPLGPTPEARCSHLHTLP